MIMIMIIINEAITNIYIHCVHKNKANYFLS